MAPAFAVWLTGLPASGKSTMARALAAALTSRGVEVAVLESDVLRSVLTPEATYSDEDRRHFYRVLSYIGTLLTEHGVAVVFDATANRRAHRQYARAVIPAFVEIYVACPVNVCKARDPKGLYRRAAGGGAVATLPGLQADYEPPLRPDLVVDGADEPPERAAQRIVAMLEQRGYLMPSGERELIWH